MTSRTCSKAYHPVGRFFSITLKRQTGITLLITAFLLLVCPGITWQASRVERTIELHVPGIATAIFLLSLLLGIILLCYNHSHLISRTSADLYYALPIKRDTLFAVRFGASFVGAAFAMTASFAGLALLATLPNAQCIPFLQLLKVYGLCLLLLLLCLSAVLIFVVNSGGIFHFIFSMLVVCIGLPVLCLIGWDWYREAAYGVVSQGLWLEYISPFSFAVLRIAALAETIESSNTVKVDVSTILVSIGGILLFLGSAFVMHRRRRTEKAGESFAFRAMPLLITVLASAMGGYLIGMIFQDGYDFGPDFWIAFLFGSTLVAVAAGAIVSKGFRKIWRWIICAGIALTVMVPMFIVTSYMGDIDFRYIPEEEDIASVTLLGSYESPEVVFTSDFDRILELHEHMVDLSLGEVERKLRHDGLLYVGYYNSDLISSVFDICYTLKNGDTVERSYWVDDYDGMLLLFDIMQTDTYAAAWAELPLEENRLVELRVWDDGETEMEMLTEEETRELLRVFGREVQEAESEILWEEEACLSLRFEYKGESFHIYVHESFTETLALLEEMMN